MIGLPRVARRAMINVGNQGIQKTSSRADSSAPSEKLKYASAFLLPAAGMFAYFCINYSATKILLGNVTTTGVLSESLPFKITSSILLPALGGLLTYFFINYSATKSLLQDFAATGALSEFLPSKIKSTIPSTADYFQLKSNKKYISRKSVETAILEFISRTEADGVYCIIYGSKGVGKTTVVEAVIHDRPGILKVKVTTAENKQQFLLKVIEVTGQFKQNPTIDDFKESLRKAISDSGVLPTVIFEVERGGNDEQILGIQAARSLSKEFASVCNCIIIISEANAVVEFGMDPSREEFIFVDELDENEVREFIGQNGMMLNEKKIRKVIDNIGSNPATLNKLRTHLRKGLSVDDFITLTLRNARLELVAFQHQPILKALKDHPEGISPEFFNKLKNEGVDLSNPKAVGAAMRKGNVITYRIERREYMIYSKAIEVALRSFDPILSHR